MLYAAYRAADAGLRRTAALGEFRRLPERIGWQGSLHQVGAHVLAGSPHLCDEVRRAQLLRASANALHHTTPPVAPCDLHATDRRTTDLTITDLSSTTTDLSSTNRTIVVVLPNTVRRPPTPASPPGNRQGERSAPIDELGPGIARPGRHQPLLVRLGQALQPPGRQVPPAGLVQRPERDGAIEAARPAGAGPLAAGHAQGRVEPLGVVGGHDGQDAPGHDQAAQAVQQAVERQAAARLAQLVGPAVEDAVDVLRERRADGLGRHPVPCTPPLAGGGNGRVARSGGHDEVLRGRSGGGPESPRPAREPPPGPEPRHPGSRAPEGPSAGPPGRRRPPRGPDSPVAASPSRTSTPGPDSGPSAARGGPPHRPPWLLVRLPPRVLGHQVSCDGR